jgi:hypothetical protein
MKRILPVMVIASAVAAFGQSPVFAKPGGVPSAPNASPPASSHAITNSNGPFSADRDFGRDRAEDRMSAQGQAHAKAAPAPKKSKKLASAKPRATPAIPATPATPGVKPATPATPAIPPDNGKA